VGEIAGLGGRDWASGRARWRDYDGDGKLVYDSAKNGPDVRKCYSNPAATEVLVINSEQAPDPGDLPEDV
jgi:hypothetical protein